MRHYDTTIYEFDKDWMIKQCKTIKSLISYYEKDIEKILTNNHYKRLRILTKSKNPNITSFEMKTFKYELERYEDKLKEYREDLSHHQWLLSEYQSRVDDPNYAPPVRYGAFA